MNNAKPTTVPLATHFKLSSNLSPTTKEEKEIMRKIPYVSAIGSIMYAMVCSRLEISHVVSLTRRFMARNVH